MLDLLISYPWALAILWAGMYVFDYASTVWLARAYQQTLSRYVMFERGVELNPNFENEIKAATAGKGPGLNAKFLILLSLVVVIILLSPIIGYLFVEFLVGALLLVWSYVNSRHLRNYLYVWALRRKPDALAGQSRHSKRDVGSRFPVGQSVGLEDHNLTPSGIAKTIADFLHHHAIACDNHARPDKIAPGDTLPSAEGNVNVRRQVPPLLSHRVLAPGRCAVQINGYIETARAFRQPAHISLASDELPHDTATRLAAGNLMRVDAFKRRTHAPRGHAECLDCETGHPPVCCIQGHANHEHSHPTEHPNPAGGPV